MERSLATILLILATGIVTYKGFTNSRVMAAYVFEVEKILVFKEYRRLVTSGFLHVSWLHFIFNALVLYVFGSELEPFLGSFPLLAIYFFSLIGGNLLALWIRKKDGAYRAVGASGAVNGIIFASIALFPGMDIGFFFLPLSIPNWLFALLYVGFTIYGIRSGRANAGHEAHLGGAVIGMLLALLMYPGAFAVNYLPVLLVLIPTAALILLMVYQPELLLMQPSSGKKQFHSIDHRYNYTRAQRQAEIDRILEKIHKKGMSSLTEKEKQLLQQHSQSGE